MTPAQIIVLATPVFLALMALEFWIGVRRGRNTYRLNDALASVGLGIVSQLVGVFSAAAMLGIYSLVFDALAFWPWPVGSLGTWLVALLLYDLCYYWKHRFGHTVALMWAAHVVHHQSEDYNLSTALRQTGSDWLVAWLFYLPLAVLGVPPLVFGAVALIDLLYQFWVHTQQIGKLGWFDRWFCSPSNHRVHHAVNKRYLDKNYGGILIVWDRLFGSFAEEDTTEPCVYGTRAPLRSWNPLWANLHIYRELLADAWRARALVDKLKVFFLHPGWRPADVAQYWPKPAFEIHKLRRYDPPLSRRAAGAAALLFVLALTGTALFLWYAHQLAPAQKLGAASALVLVLCAVAWSSTTGAPGQDAPHE